MATVFLSHASKDDELAQELEAWLRRHGFDDLFIDHSDIRGGDKWTEALRRAKGAARAVLCLVTPRWLASDECAGEFTSAWYAGQRIVPLLAGTTDLDPLQTKRLGRVLGEDQGFDLSPALTNGHLDLDAVPEIAEPLKAGLRAAGALAKIGLDPEAFEIDEEIRPSPFPGLQSFGDTDADAAIFYGRSPQIASCLEDLRQMRASGERKPYAILGPSGSGKSSLLKAGVLPRLRRERGWLVLRTFRPGVDPLFNVAEAIAQSLADHGDKRAPGIRDRLRATWDQAEKHEGFATDAGLSTLRETLETEVFSPLRERADRSRATVLLSLDQAEELARTEGEGADVLCDYLRAALLPPLSSNGDDASAGAAMIALTARSDSFPELQTARRFAGLDARCADIRPVPLHRFDDAIEKPAARYSVQIEPGLIEAMIEDAPGADALPLFAFAMENLWRRYHQERRIRPQDYDSIGRLAGLIDGAAERALRGILPSEDRSVEKRVPEERDELAAKTFVPGLAQLSESGAAIRRIAPLDRFDARARELLGPFDQWRLVVKREGQDGTSTVEVAHEAIFRGWHRFQRWLEPAKSNLEALRGLETSARVWDGNGCKRAYVDHRGRRLKAAKNLLRHTDFKNEVRPSERAYLAAASGVQRRRHFAVAAIALVVMTGGGTVAWMFENDASPRELWSYAVPRAKAETNVLAARIGLADLVIPEMVEVKGRTLPVSAADAFAIGKYEVTFDEWEICVADGGCNDYWPPDYGSGRGRKPVTSVSWEDAHAYVVWLSEVTGEEYRLPSREEWEYAARGGTTTRYWWGDDISSAHANFRSGVRQTVNVGSYPPNPFGLYDVIGNALEWVDARKSIAQSLLGGSGQFLPDDMYVDPYQVEMNAADTRDNRWYGFRVARALR